MPEPVRIVKVDSPSPTPSQPTQPVGGRKKSMRTFPRGVLKKTAKAKIEPTRDPSKSPPMKKGTLRILTDKGVERRRKHIKKTVKQMPDKKVKDILQKAGMNVSEKTPPSLAREILVGGMEAGMIVAK